MGPVICPSGLSQSMRPIVASHIKILVGVLAPPVSVQLCLKKQ